MCKEIILVLLRLSSIERSSVTMIVFPPCKINIGLYITEKRSDGFHNLESIFYPVNFCDVLEAVCTENHMKTMKLSLSGIPIPCDISQNLLYKVFDLFAAKTEVRPVEAHLHKIVPMGAGLGGGSADAAMFLDLLNLLHGHPLSNSQLKDLAVQAGSDCAFFLQTKPALCTGKGDILNTTPLSLAGKFIVILVPEFQISTATAYAKVKPKAAAFDLSNLHSLPLSDWRDAISNDFEDALKSDFPEINSLKQVLYEHGAFYASLSGSGSAVFGLFETKPDYSFGPYCKYSGFLN